jgi:hypothetical protein
MKKLMNKKVNLFGKGIPVFAIVLMSLALVSAALIPYYGKIVGLATLNQGLVLDGTSSYLDDVTCNLGNIFGGDTRVCSQWVKNKANNPITIEFTNLQQWKNSAENWVDASDAVTTNNLGILELSSKDSSWEETDDRNATLTYKLVSDNFEYKLDAEGLDNVEYSIIYYADQNDRFVNWGGDNPGRVIGTFTPESDGTYSTDGFVVSSVGIDLPVIADDWNAQADPDYCNKHNGFDDYEMCQGAKIWIVPSTDYNVSEKKVTAWNPSEYLFETDLITFDAGGDGLVVFPGRFMLHIESTFNPLAMPGDYKITTEVKPAA